MIDEDKLWSDIESLLEDSDKEYLSAMELYTVIYTQEKVRNYESIYQSANERQNELDN